MLQARKHMTYATRRLKPGDLFKARSRSDERILLALKRARRLGDEPPSPPPGQPARDDIQSLRSAYAEKFGKRPYHGWDAAELREKLAES